MTNGVVDFNVGGFGESSDFVPPAMMATLETFSLNGRTDENQGLFSVGDLGLKNLNTAFKDDALEAHVMASTLEASDPWILFDQELLRIVVQRTLLRSGHFCHLQGRPHLCGAFRVKLRRSLEGDL